VGDVDDADAGRDALHDGFADADGVVFDVEVGEEADDLERLWGGCGRGGAGSQAEREKGSGGGEKMAAG